MKDEIKEILEYVLSLTYGNENAIKGINKVEDYITNLQEEVKLANESITWWQNRFNALQEENKRLSIELNKNMIERNNYLSRNEKAIEILEQDKASASFNTAERIALNILQGSDNNE